MKKIYYRKLVRDKIPEVIKKSGGDFETYKLAKKEFEKELLKKVGEESDGLLTAKTKEELISEMADIVEVIEEIKRFKKITSQQVENARKANFRRKGGFKKRLFLVCASDTGYRSNERRYGRRSRKK